MTPRLGNRKPSESRQPRRETAAAAPVNSPRFSLTLAAILMGLTPWLVWPSGGVFIDPNNALKWPVVAAGMLAVIVLTALAERSRARAGEPVAPPPWREPLAWGAAAIIGGMALSAIAGGAPGLGLRLTLREGLFAIYAVCLARLAARPAELRLAALWLIGSGAGQALLALVQAWGPEPLRAALRQTLGVGVGRWAYVGTFSNPEYLAGWLAAAGAAATVLALDRPRAGRAARGFRLWAAVWAAAAVMALVVFASGGRGAFAAWCGGLAIWGAVRWLAARRARAPAKAMPDTARGPVPVGRGARPWRIALALSIGLALLAALFWSNPQDLPTRIRQAFDPYTDSVRHRLTLLAVTGRMIAERPLLGCGPGRYGAGYGDTLASLTWPDPESDPGRRLHVGPWMSARLLSGNYVGEAHCDWLQWWAEYGLLPVLGLLCILALALTAARIGDDGDGAHGPCWAGARGPSASVHGPWADAAGPWLAALWTALVVLALVMWVSFPLHRPGRELAFWTLAGLLAGTRRGQ